MKQQTDSLKPVELKGRLGLIRVRGQLEITLVLILDELSPDIFSLMHYSERPVTLRIESREFVGELND